MNRKRTAVGLPGYRSYLESLLMAVPLLMQWQRLKSQCFMSLLIGLKRKNPSQSLFVNYLSRPLSAISEVVLSEKSLASSWLNSDEDDAGSHLR